jgi:signal transduction histidine kinase
LQVSSQSFVYDNDDCILLNIRDITEFQQLQDERNRVHMMKMLTAAVSHDMMNPIANIKFFAQ